MVNEWKKRWNSHKGHETDIWYFLGYLQRKMIEENWARNTGKLHIFHNYLSQSDDNEDLTGSSNNGTDVRFCLRQPSPVPKGSSLVSENYPNKFTIPDFVCKKSRFASGHLCLKCKEKPPLGLCNICKNHWYCSTSCQTKDWPEHQKMCTNESNRKRTIPVFNSRLIRFPLQSDILNLEQKSRKYRTKQTVKSTNCIKCGQNQPYFLCHSSPRF